MDYFNEEERERRKFFDAMRDTVFSPIVTLFVRVGASPNQVSAAGVVLLIASSLLPPDSPWLISFGLSLYILCDGIDGALARRLERVHDGGALVDIVADQLGVVFLPAAACVHFAAWAPGMVLFAAFYLIFIALVVYANALDITLRRFLRVKYVFFLLYVASAFSGRDLLTHFGLAFGVYYMVETILVLRRIHAHHDRHHAAEHQHDRPRQAAKTPHRRITMPNRSSAPSE